MIVSVPLLALSFALILVASELFTNGVEWVGARLGLGHGALGSVLAALGTALPETIIPVIAIVFVGSASGTDVGIGAILGSTVFKTTASFAVAGFGIVIFRKRRAHGLNLSFDADAIGRDFTFFLIVFIAGIVASFIPLMAAKYAIALALCGAYLFYALRAVMNSGEAGDEEDLSPLRLHRLSGGIDAPPTWMAWLQLLFALGIIVGSADLFVNEMEHVADALHLGALALSLLLTPFATELPEMFNSTLWVREGKDTLALGNLSGSVVFQASVPLSIGIVFTDWKLSATALIAAGLAIASSLIVFFYVRRGQLTAPVLLRAGLFWVAFLVYVVAKTAVG